MKTLQRQKAVELIPLDSLHPSPDQTRAAFEPKELEALAASIAAAGLLNPITLRVRPEGGYYIIAGHRRAEACRLLGRSEIEAIVLQKNAAESAAATIIENLQRRDLTPLEEARGVRRLMELCGMSQSKVCGLLGLSQPALSNKLRLLRLPESVQSAAERYRLGERVCRALLRLPDEAAQLSAAEHIAKRELGAAESERYIEGQLSRRKSSPLRIGILRDYRLLFSTMDKAVEEIRRAGIAARAQQSIEEDCVCYTVRIPRDLRTLDSGQLSLY